MFPLLIAASLVFTPADAAFAYSNAVEIVRDCSPRDAGTIRGGIAAVALCLATSLFLLLFSRLDPLGEVGPGFCPL